MKSSISFLLLTFLLGVYIPTGLDELLRLAAAALGACVVERHVTLDRAMWGSDQAASVERQGMMRLVRDIRLIEVAMGDGVKRIYDSEAQARLRLRKSDDS